MTKVICDGCGFDMSDALEQIKGLVLELCAQPRKHLCEKCLVKNLSRRLDDLLNELYPQEGL